MGDKKVKAKAVATTGLELVVIPTVKVKDKLIMGPARRLKAKYNDNVEFQTAQAKLRAEKKTAEEAAAQVTKGVLEQMGVG